MNPTRTLRHPLRTLRSYFASIAFIFAFAFVLAFLSVIPAGDLLLLKDLS